MSTKQGGSSQKGDPGAKREPSRRYSSLTQAAHHFSCCRGDHDWILVLEPAPAHPLVGQSK